MDQGIFWVRINYRGLKSDSNTLLLSLRIFIFYVLLSVKEMPQLIRQPIFKKSTQGLKNRPRCKFSPYLVTLEVMTHQALFSFVGKVSWAGTQECRNNSSRVWRHQPQLRAWIKSWRSRPNRGPLTPRKLGAWSASPSAPAAASTGRSASAPCTCQRCCFQNLPVR